MSIERIAAFVLRFSILIIIEIIRYIKAKLLNRKFKNLKELNIIIFSIYIMGLISVTLLPLSTDMHYEVNVNFMFSSITIN